MDEDSCVMKLVEIVPVDNNGMCSESADVKLSPCHIKVCSLYTVCCYLQNLMPTNWEQKITQHWVDYILCYTTLNLALLA